MRVIESGKREDAGQHYYRIFLRADDPDEVATKLEAEYEDTEWQVRTYPKGGKPVAFDPETGEEVEVNVRVKKNLYNDHHL